MFQKSIKVTTTRSTAMKKSKNLVHFDPSVQSFHPTSTKFYNSKILKENAFRKLAEKNLQPTQNSNTDGKIML